jgi:hypothetical protein
MNKRYFPFQKSCLWNVENLEGDRFAFLSLSPHLTFMAFWKCKNASLFILRAFPGMISEKSDGRQTLTAPAEAYET